MTGARGRKAVWRQASWEDLIRGQFDELRNAGLTHPLMQEIEEQFAAGG